MLPTGGSSNPTLGVAQAGGKRNLLIVNIEDLRSTVTTDRGRQTSTLNGQIVLEQVIDERNRTTLLLKTFNLTGTGVETSQGRSGLISLGLKRGSAQVLRFDNQTGEVEIGLDLVLHYPLIDKLKGFMPPDQEGDNFASFTETMRGRIIGRFARPLQPEPAQDNDFSANARFSLYQSVLGGMGLLEFLSERGRLFIIPKPCVPSEVISTRRTICVQPVFVQTGPGDPAPTGSSFPTLMENAEDIWAKCCVRFDFQDPIYVNDADLKELTTSEASELRDTVDNDDCIEVFFIGSWSPMDYAGGGVTWGGGTASAKIIVADNVLDPPPGCGKLTICDEVEPSYNNLAHELGHALGLCHPTGSCSISSPVFATPETVMAGSGFCCDNPSLQSLFNCENVSNPLLMTTTESCCPTPEIPATSTLTIANVSAASFSNPPLAAESIVTAFGYNLATITLAATANPLPTSLAGTTVAVRDSAGVMRLAPLFFVSPTQINYQMPPGTAAGMAIVIVTSGDGTVTAGAVQIATVAPGLFTADASGKGLAAAIALRIRAGGAQSFEPVAQYNPAQNRFIAVPIDLGPVTDQVYLILFGTGERNRSSLSAVNVKIGGIDAPVNYAGMQGGFVGVDQINARIPRGLAGRGEVDVILTADGKPANTVKINIK
jgi:uncharacterized protein (TIGR03437 family)